MDAAGHKSNTARLLTGAVLIASATCGSSAWADPAAAPTATWSVPAGTVAADIAQPPSPASESAMPDTSANAGAPARLTVEQAAGPAIESPASAPSEAAPPSFVIAGPPSPDSAYDLAKAATPVRRHRTFGMTMDIGVPDGAALGIVVRPRFDWLRLAAAVTHNGIAPGLRLGVTLDPIAFPIAPTLTIEGGHYWAGPLPMIQGSPSIGYDYANFHLGLEIGNRATFRFFLRGGVSWVDMSGAQAQNTSGNGSSIDNPSYTGWLAPSAKLGFSLYF